VIVRVSVLDQTNRRCLRDHGQLIGATIYETNCDEINYNWFTCRHLSGLQLWKI